MYESKELSTPNLMGHNFREKNTPMRYGEGKSSTRLHSPDKDNEISLNSRLKNRTRHSEEREPKNTRSKAYQN